SRVCWRRRSICLRCEASSETDMVGSLLLAPGGPSRAAVGLNEDGAADVFRPYRAGIEDPAQDEAAFIYRSASVAVVLASSARPAYHAVIPGERAGDARQAPGPFTKDGGPMNEGRFPSDAALLPLDARLRIADVGERFDRAWSGGR